MTMLGHGHDALFAPGEDILWQGRPGAGLIWADVLERGTFVGAFFTGFSIFWIHGARSSASPDEPLAGLIFPLAGVVFLALGLWLMIGRHLWDIAIRSGTSYTLTSSHAYITRDTFGQRSREAWPLAELSAIHLIDRTPGAVLFDAPPEVRMRHARADRIKPPFSGYKRALGFRQIEDPRRVHRLLSEARDRLLEDA